MTGGACGFLTFITPFFNKLLKMCESICRGHSTIGNSVFEFKYIVLFAIFVLLYVSTNLLTTVINKLEDTYENGVRLAKKMEEKALNKALQDNITKKEKRIKQYKIYISTLIKKKYNNSNFKVNLEEQNKVMNKFIIGKVGIKPVIYKDGFVYSFYDFDKIDDVLDVFMKVKNAKTPLDYYICVQAFGDNAIIQMSRLDRLISLKATNKIIMSSDTSYRYSFNENQRYKTCQIGVFQKENDTTFEVHEFCIQ